ncbi:MAG: hypothetical protein AB1476_04200 [Candidatus Hadarchaeota archaeon]
MPEEERRIAKEVLSSVLPYIAYPQELRERLEKGLQASENRDAFVENLKRTIADENDVTKKTDLRIFLAEFRRHV